MCPIAKHITSKCSNIKCQYAHTIQQLRPRKCTFDIYCRDDKCSFYHSNQPLPTPEMLYARLSIKGPKESKKLFVNTDIEEVDDKQVDWMVLLPKKIDFEKQKHVSSKKLLALEKLLHFIEERSTDSVALFNHLSQMVLKFKNIDTADPEIEICAVRLALFIQEKLENNVHLCPQSFTDRYSPLVAFVYRVIY